MDSEIEIEIQAKIDDEKMEVITPGIQVDDYILFNQFPKFLITKYGLWVDINDLEQVVYFWGKYKYEFNDWFKIAQKEEVA